LSQQINLYNPAFEQKKKLFGATAMAQALVVLIVGVAALAFYADRSIAFLRNEAENGQRQVDQKRKQLAAVAAEFRPRQKSPELDAELADAEAQLASLQRIAGVLERGELGNTAGYSEYFRAFARRHADGLWLTGLSISGAGSEIGVNGRALDPGLIPGYLGQLTREAVLQGKAFGSLQISQVQPARVTGKDGKESASTAPYVEFSLQSTHEGAKP
jgi:hypothetical protein